MPNCDLSFLCFFLKKLEDGEQDLSYERNVHSYTIKQAKRGRDRHPELSNSIFLYSSKESIN